MDSEAIGRHSLALVHSGVMDCELMTDVFPCIIDVILVYLMRLHLHHRAWQPSSDITAGERATCCLSHVKIMSPP